ncbi:hypothetical protein [Terrihabitans sp. B22-R8]|uniref:hypothetical protein n=1 Tax=Terrihabitans sp. B22-R8 TaxID=3425128 RepID=UPI00403D51F6
MASVTYFVVQPFENTERGLVVGEAKQAQSEHGARSLAQRLAAKGGAIAFSRTGDPQFGDFEDAVVLGFYGTVPEDAAEMAAVAA